MTPSPAAPAILEALRQTTGYESMTLLAVVMAAMRERDTA